MLFEHPFDTLLSCTTFVVFKPFKVLALFQSFSIDKERNPYKATALVVLLQTNVTPYKGSICVWCLKELLQR